MIKKAIALICVPLSLVASRPGSTSSLEEVWESSPTASPKDSQASSPSLNSPGSPVLLEWKKDVEPRIKLVERLSKELTDLEQQHKDVLKQLEVSRKQLNGSYSLHQLSATQSQMSELTQAAQDDIQRMNDQCKELSKQITATQGKLQRADADLKRVEIIHGTQKIIGLGNYLAGKQEQYEKNETHLAAAHTHINTFLPGAYQQQPGVNPFSLRGKDGKTPKHVTFSIPGEEGPELTQPAALRELMDRLHDLCALKQKAAAHETALTQRKDAILNAEIDAVINLRKDIAKLQIEVDHLAKAIYPNLQERETVLQNHQATMVATPQALHQSHNPAAPLADTTRNTTAKVALIRIVIPLGQ